MRVTRHSGEHTCGSLKLGRFHVMAIVEWIVNKSEGQYDDSQELEDIVVRQQVLECGTKLLEVSPGKRYTS